MQPGQGPGPSAQDIISFDVQRLRLFFQLGLLEDSGRGSSGLNLTGPGLVELTNVEGLRKALTGGSWGRDGKGVYGVQRLWSVRIWGGLTMWSGLH